jgi:UDP-N-acetylglucosamine 2-epimerase (non-hydrolysing)
MSSKRKIALIVGARPNFMKAAPLIEQLNNHSDKFEQILIHTGQHYDDFLSKYFFDDLKMPDSDIYLGVGSGSHGKQTGEIIIRLENELEKIKPDLTVVFGDINSTLAAAVVTSKLHLKLAHIEAGLRSFDNRMPEEINRIVTDRLSDLLFVTEQAGVDNLINEGISEDKIYLVGNIMTDSLKKNLPKAESSEVLKDHSLNPNEYITLTLHRPSNVDDKTTLKRLLVCLSEISEKIPVVFPCHPRTVKMINKFGYQDFTTKPNFKIIEPLGYIDFLKLMSESKAVISDSGGIQGDATILNIPCLTLRDSTEHPVTIETGTNQLCDSDPKKIHEAINKILSGEDKRGVTPPPPLWDGNTASRIVDILLKSI